MINFEMELPMKVSTNKIYAGMHWTQRKKIADAFHASIAELIEDGNIVSFGIEKYPVDIFLEFKFINRPLDSSNSAGFMGKCIEDGLHKANVIPDDTPKYVRWFCSKSSPNKHEKNTVLVTIIEAYNKKEKLPIQRERS